jgi:hypothetical protein
MAQRPDIDVDVIVQDAAARVEESSGIRIENGARRLLRSWARQNADQIDAARDRGWDHEKFVDAAVEVLAEAARTKRATTRTTLVDLGTGYALVQQPEGSFARSVDAKAASEAMQSKCPFYGFSCR